MTRHRDDPALLATALAIAARAHAGQVDRAGRSYLAHPLRVAARVVDAGDEVVAAALLHDVLEDSALTVDDLVRAGLPGRVVEAVEHLTRRPGESHGAAVQRAAAHPMASIVKRADIADNTDPARLALLPAELRARLTAKYAHALAVLEDAVDTADTPTR